MDRLPPFLLFALGLGLAPLAAQTSPAAPATTLLFDAGRVTAHVSPTLYGLMTEEINHAYDGGVYGELVSNRAFRDDATTPLHWSIVGAPGSVSTIALDRSQRLSPALPVSLRFKLSAANDWGGVANDGYWGVPIRPDTFYDASFYAEPGPGFQGPINVSLESSDGRTTWATERVYPIQPGWHAYAVRLHTGSMAPAEGKFVLWTTNPGTFWLSLVSLFPPTWHNRINGNRPDLMQLLSDMRPAFLRLPGGNYLEGRTIDTRFDWKRTVGPLIDRPGHLDDAWGYRSSDGMGLLELLEWCEDLDMKPVLAVFDGLMLDARRGVPPVAVAAGPRLQPYVQDALDEIEYVIGGQDTIWGRQRAEDGHPAPFPLDCVEIGNEDGFDRTPGSYDSRFAQFYDAIKDRYPDLQVIATDRVTSRTPDLLDEHFYRSADQMEADADHYDSAIRSGPQIFVGEWATREGSPTPNMNAALGDAAWMTGLERNSDLVVMASYAPLFTNVNPGAMQWKTDLIGYDGLRSYGSPSYYAQVMFSRNHGDLVLAAQGRAVPTRLWQPPAPRNGGARPPARDLPTLFFEATRDSASGTVFLKLVNTAGLALPVHVELAGASQVDPQGTAITLSASSPQDTNSIDEPTKIVPVAEPVSGLGRTFDYTLKAYSITVLKLQTH